MSTNIDVLYEFIAKGAKIALITITSTESHINRCMVDIIKYTNLDENRGHYNEFDGRDYGYSSKNFGYFNQHLPKDVLKILDYAYVYVDNFHVTNDEDVKYAVDYYTKDLPNTGIMLAMRDDDICELDNYEAILEKKVEELLQDFNYVVTINLNYEIEIYER